MPIECSICISSFKDPVCLPCGHLYCKTCLSGHVNVPTNPGMTSTCPDCRTVFNIAIPDLTYLPEKYHPFISHAVRRVYIDVASHSTLQKKLKQAEKRIESMKQTEQLLLERGEKYQRAMMVHKNGEREAVERLAEVEERLDEAEAESRESIARLEAQLGRMELENHKMNVKCKKLTSRTQDMEIRIKQLQQEMAKKAEDSDLDSLSGYNLSSSPQYITPNKPPTRTIKPLPRRSQHRRMREESDSPPPSFVRPKRARILG